MVQESQKRKHLYHQVLLTRYIFFSKMLPPIESEPPSR